jgi:hypothetical protein
MCRFVIHCITLVVAGNSSAQYVRCARRRLVGSRAADSPSYSRARSRTRVPARVLACPLAYSRAFDTRSEHKKCRRKKSPDFRRGSQGLEVRLS